MHLGNLWKAHLALFSVKKSVIPEIIGNGIIPRALPQCSGLAEVALDVLNLEQPSIASSFCSKLIAQSTTSTAVVTPSGVTTTSDTTITSTITTTVETVVSTVYSTVTSTPSTETVQKRAPNTASSQCTKRKRKHTLTSDTTSTQSGSSASSTKPASVSTTSTASKSPGAIISSLVSSYAASILTQACSCYEVAPNSAVVVTSTASAATSTVRSTVYTTQVSTVYSSETDTITTTSTAPASCVASPSTTTINTVYAHATCDLFPANELGYTISNYNLASCLSYAAQNSVGAAAYLEASSVCYYGDNRPGSITSRSGAAYITVGGT